MSMRWVWGRARRTPCGASLALALAFTPSLAQAQPVQTPSAPASPGAAPAAGAQQGSTTTTQTVTYSPPVMNSVLRGTGPVNPDAHLGSSSQSKTDIDSPDSFDLKSAGDGQTATLHGNADAPGVTSENVEVNSGVHVVQAGDTLSKISQQVYGQPWMWPKLWAQNPQVQNPHWIYPGDQILLTGPTTAAAPGEAHTLGAGASPLRRSLVPEDSVFLRQLGYIDDPAKGIAGEIVGGIEPVQLMAEGQHVYIVFKADQDLHVGQVLTIFRALRDPPKVEGARQPPGKLVALQGSVKLEYVNGQKHIARGVILESLDTIERGAKVGFVEDRHKIVPPKRVDHDVTARILTSMYPHVVIGQNQVVFIDRGSIDGLVEGNRLFVTRRGDTWRRTLATSTAMARTRINLSADKLNFEAVPLNGNEQDFPEEVVAELRIIKAHKFSSLAVVSSSQVEIQSGDRAIARAGF